MKRVVNPVHTLKKLALCAGLGFLWTLSYPQWQMVGFAWIIPACLIALSANLKLKAVFGWCYLASWIHSATTLYWLLNMPHFAGAIAGWLSLTLYTAIYPALWACLFWGLLLRSQILCQKAVQKRKGTLEWFRSLTLIESQRIALVGAMLWVGAEWMMSHLLTGFPWLILGATQLTWGPLAQTASLGGVSMISFVMVWTSLSVGMGLIRTQLTNPHPWKWIPDSILPLGVVLLLNVYGYQRIQLIESLRSEETIRVGLVQPAFPQTLIWDAEEDQTRFEELLKLSEAALQLSPDLLLWPEGAFPGNVNTVEPLWELLNKYKAWLCFNGTDVDVKSQETDNPRIYNSAFLMDPSGRLKGTYHKRHLVMFGEFVPFSDQLPFLKMLTPIQNLFTAGVEAQVFHLPDMGVALYPLICFEDVMPYLCDQTRQKKADILINLTNDGWFKESAAQIQHASLAAFRSIETGLPMIRCGNNGLSCWIDPAGKIRATDSGGDPSDVYDQGFRIVEIPKNWEMKPTVYQKVGRFFPAVCFWAGLLPSLFLILKSRRSREIKSKN